LDKDSSTDIKPKVGHIGGPLNQIVPSLVSAFDVAIIPRCLKLEMKVKRPPKANNRIVAGSGTAEIT